MSRFAFRRMTAVFVLIAVLGVPLSSVAAPRAAAERTESRPPAMAVFVGWLTVLLAPGVAKSNCVIDPYGACIPAKNNKPNRRPRTAPHPPFSVAF